MNFYSQQGEDFFLYLNLINRFRFDGTVVEVGAFDGVTYSNSKMFEETLGFKSLLIEPSQISFEKLKRNRPNSHCLNVAVGSKAGARKFLGAHAIAGIVDELPIMHLEKLHSEGFVENDVQVLRLDEIFEDAGISQVDVLSIDVEGGEFEVLKGINVRFLRSSVSVVVIELDTHNQVKDAHCRVLLESCGFIKYFRLGINEFYLNRTSGRVVDLYCPTRCPPDLYEFVRQSKYYTLEPHIAKEVIAASINFFSRRML